MGRHGAAPEWRRALGGARAAVPCCRCARGSANSVECADAAEQEARQDGVCVVYGAFRGGGSLQSGEAAHRGIGVFFIGQRRARERGAAREQERCGIGTGVRARASYCVPNASYCVLMRANAGECV